MDFKISIIPYMGIRILAMTQPIFGQSGWLFYGNSGDYYYVYDGFLKEILFLAGKWASGTTRPDQKVGPMSGPFGSTVSVISKNMF